MDLGREGKKKLPKQKRAGRRGGKVKKRKKKRAPVLEQQKSPDWAREGGRTLAKGPSKTMGRSPSKNARDQKKKGEHGKNRQRSWKKKEKKIKEKRSWARQRRGIETATQGGLLAHKANGLDGRTRKPWSGG